MLPHTAHVAAQPNSSLKRPAWQYLPYTEGRAEAISRAQAVLCRDLGAVRGPGIQR